MTRRTALVAAATSGNGLVIVRQLVADSHGVSATLAVDGGMLKGL